MSRPFSYSDQNFTVIGNILFVHITDMAEREINEPIVEVPYEIYKRLYTHSNNCRISIFGEGASSTSVNIGIDNNRFIYFNSKRPRSSTRRMYCTWYLLKDA